MKRTFIHGFDLAYTRRTRRRIIESAWRMLCLILLPLSYLNYDNSRFLKWKRPSALCAPTDGFLVSAGVPFKKDRQKDRQLIRLLTPETGQRLTDYFFSSISYEIAGEELTMLRRSSLMPYKSLN